MELYDLTVHELKEKLENNEITSLDIVKSYSKRIEEKEKDVDAFITLLCDDALKQAEQIDIRRKKGQKLSPLAGIPIGIKDNMCVKGIKTTCASKMLENFIAPYDATVIKKIRQNDMIIFGKMNMDEFAMGSSTENSAFKKTKNPWDLNKIPGGSSGGSAAAVASDMIPWALGSDTGGSIRQPASCCGMVGLKSTYGRVSRYGLVAFASSLDQIGPMTKDVKDAAMLLDVIAGYDVNDSTSAKVEKKDYVGALTGDIKGIKIGVPKEYFAKGIDEEVKKEVLAVVDKYKKMGAIVEECSLDTAQYALATYYIIADAECSSNLGRFDGIRYGYRAKEFNNLKELYVNSRSEAFGEEVKRRILLGTYVLSSGYYDAYYKKAQKVRTLVKNKFNEQLSKYDVILTPTTPIKTFNIGEKADDPLSMYLCDICTVSVNIAGLPAISVPCSLDSNGMPIGFQLIGNYFGEDKLLNVAYAYEMATDFRKNKPTFKNQKGE